ncbi:UNVERIFIED_CONTAM: Tricyclene synthase 1e20, chloroplastic [Sesamum latifolium]|uniref:Tricyclene synthase 1e20, chloroplastic n=1 Tax=Sesamum latifolium TaxID=2727402 RepID=A0AAW2WMM2_9LAMI
MASCYGLSHLSLPCSLKTRPGFARIGKREPALVVVSSHGAGKQKWNISVASTSEASRLHPDKFEIEYEEKIEEIRYVLQAKGEDELSESLVLVDAIQRVGLSSYYEEEIETLLRKHYVASCSCIYDYHSLHDVSLLFRLLRQHGHYISPDVEDKLSRMVIGINEWGKTLRELALVDLRKGQSVYQEELDQVSKLGEEAKAREESTTKMMCHRALLDTTNEIGREITKHGHNPIKFSLWASLCNAYLVEAKWFASGVSPTADMHLENGKISTGVYMVLVHLFFLLGLGRTNGDTINLPDISQLLSCVATILRLWNDLGGAKDGNEDGTDGSYIDCYMKDHPGLSEAQARDRALDIIASQWKILNKECFCLNDSSASSFIRASLNLARIVPLMYDYDGNQRLPVLEDETLIQVATPGLIRKENDKTISNKLQRLDIGACVFGYYLSFAAIPWQSKDFKLLSEIPLRQIVEHSLGILKHARAAIMSPMAFKDFWDPSKRLKESR